MGETLSGTTRQEPSGARLFSHLPHFRKQHCLFQPLPWAHHYHISQRCTFPSPELCLERCHGLKWLQECRGWDPVLCPTPSEAPMPLVQPRWLPARCRDVPPHFLRPATTNAGPGELTGRSRHTDILSGVQFGDVPG